MVAPQTRLRNQREREAKGRARGRRKARGQGQYKGRDTPWDTPTLAVLVAAPLIGVGLSGIRTASARHGLEDFRLFTGTGVLHKMPDVDDRRERRRLQDHDGRDHGEPRPDEEAPPLYPVSAYTILETKVDLGIGTRGSRGHAGELGGGTAALLHAQLDPIRDDLVGVRPLLGGFGLPLGGPAARRP